MLGNWGGCLKWNVDPILFSFCFALRPLHVLIVNGLSKCPITDFPITNCHYVIGSQ